MFWIWSCSSSKPFDSCSSPSFGSANFICDSLNHSSDVASRTFAQVVSPDSTALIARL